MHAQAYVVVGTVEDIGQTYVGGPFEASYSKECVAVFFSRGSAEKFIVEQKLAKPRKDSTFSGTSHYRGGYCELDINECPARELPTTEAVVK